jgi:MraZ protein
MSDEGTRKFLRFFWGSACEAERDTQYRVVIPQNLRAYAGINKEIVSVGVARRIEIWSRENYTVYQDSAGELDPGITARMAELGI